jgi:uncharacterized membrane protein YdbT with pleckstrin-like domain
MPFPRKLLNEGEDIVLDLRPHWWGLVKPALAVIVAAALVILVANAIDNDIPTYAAVALLVFTVGWMVARYLGWASTNFVVTTDRLIHRAGVLGKSGREIPLERVNDIAVNQTFLERLIGKGDLMIESGGERGQQHFTDVRRPFVVQNTIYREMERAGARDAERATGSRELSIPEQIEKLDELRQRGVVTQAEFEAKKAQLLERM